MRFIARRNNCVYNDDASVFCNSVSAPAQDAFTNLVRPIVNHAFEHVDVATDRNGLQDVAGNNIAAI